MVKNYITAAEAKTLTRTSTKLESSMYKAIKEMADYGNNHICFSVSEADPYVVDRLEKSLKDAGYIVKREIADLDSRKDVVWGLDITW